MFAFRCLPPGRCRSCAHDGLELPSQRITSSVPVGEVRRRSITSVFANSQKRVGRVSIQCEIQAIYASRCCEAALSAVPDERDKDTKIFRISNPHRPDGVTRWEASLYDSKVNVDLGYNTGNGNKYKRGWQLGKGGWGVVRSAICTETRRQYACKSIRKVILLPLVKRVGVARTRHELENRASRSDS